MKKNMIAMTVLLLQSFTAFASHTDAVAFCVSRIGYAQSDACIGVKTDLDAKMVASCVEKLGYQQFEACTGVKRETDVTAVVACVQKLGYAQAKACMGVKN